MPNLNDDFNTKQYIENFFAQRHANVLQAQVQFLQSVGVMEEIGDLPAEGVGHQRQIDNQNVNENRQEEAQPELSLNELPQLELESQHTQSVQEKEAPHQVPVQVEIHHRSPHVPMSSNNRKMHSSADLFDDTSNEEDLNCNDHEGIFK